MKPAQLTHIKTLLAYLSAHSAFYQDLFRQHQIDVTQINSLADFQKIPFTEKEDLHQQAEKFICVAPNKLIDYVTTSGTTGKPVSIALTDKDLNRLAQNECASFQMAGIGENDIIQLMTTIDRRFMAGLAYFLGARKLGAGIIRVGNGIPELQWDTILQMKPTVMVCVPSFILKLIAYAEQKGIPYQNSSLQKAICIGEPIRNADFSLNALGRRIQDKWPLALHSTYASSEMATAFTECSAFKGGHLQEDLLFAELVDESGAAVKAGEAGELVITTFGIEGMPLLRFKTGDICQAHTEVCTCGRTSLRLGPVLGRKKQMIKFKGTSLYPSALFDVLENFEEIENYQVEVHNDALDTDAIVVRIGTTKHVQIADQLSDLFRARVRVVPELQFSTAEEIHKRLFAGNSRKPLKFIDNRKSH